jgi:hypothetical protein
MLACALGVGAHFGAPVWRSAVQETFKRPHSQQASTQHFCQLQLHAALPASRRGFAQVLHSSNYYLNFIIIIDFIIII